MPYLEINLKKIEQNFLRLKKVSESKKFSVMGITKVVLGNPTIAKALVKAGLKYIGDSRIGNIIRMKKSGVNAQFVLIRVPSLSELQLVIKHADMSLNSELEVIKKLSELAIIENKKHGIILMVEMGDLREGIMPDKLEETVSQILRLKGIELAGIGTNLKCFAGVIPDEENMKSFSELAQNIQKKFGITLNFVSGGNSANYNWLVSNADKGIINNLRIGTIIFLGIEGIDEKPIPGYHHDAITFVAEIIECKKKPRYPKGTITTNAFGETSIFKDKYEDIEGLRNQALLNVGRQDINERGLIPIDDVEIMSASSDYIVIDLKDNEFNVGDKLRFHVNYEALLGAMTSPFVSKVFI
ncbi:MAG: alanine/ornithine racemase family PLP-dependent enzyme [Promethearchaeota archaeon]|nr:MAG: alanine/ornithine racemase family PLP-dependent enzyme [Candidatus Lokiarchaeota archaeon]